MTVRKRAAGWLLMALAWGGAARLAGADAGPVQTNRFLEVTSEWRYHVAKQDLGTAWRAPDYDDAAWDTGGGLLYVENSGLPAPKTTALPLTPRELPATCYFRTRFVNDLANVRSIQLQANTVIDDAAVFYLNGVEVFRLGMPEGTIQYDTRSARTVGNASWEGPFELPADQLRSGENVVAVEVHQTSATSSDIVMGLTLDAIWQANVHDTTPPLVTRVLPAEGATVGTLTQLEVWFDEPVSGVDAADLLINGAPASSVSQVAADHYVFEFGPPAAGEVTVVWAAGHGITDQATDRNPFGGGSFSYLLDPTAFAEPLAFAEVTQSSDASAGNRAARAVDGANATFSLTADQPGSFWQADLSRAFPVNRITLVNRPAPDDGELAGLTLRLFNLDDQVVFETVLTNPGPGGVAVFNLPAGAEARRLWIGLPGDATNGAGNHRVGLAEVRVYGRPGIPFGPDPYVPPGGPGVRVWQSSEYPGFPAENAVDGDLNNFTHTDDIPDSFWMADLGKVLPFDKVEVVNRKSCCAARLGGLTLRIYDGASNTVATATLTNPGLGETWSFTPPAGTAGRWLRIGLEDGRPNEDDNHYVSFAEARVFSGGVNVLHAGGSPVPVIHNLASGKRSYMLRLQDSVPPAANANDDDYNTETKTTSRTVDGYWEVDLGETAAVYGLRLIAASGIGARLDKTTVRLYDAAHQSVYAQPVTGEPDVFDVDLGGPHFARYVRVGLENKQRTDPAGGIEWWIGFREVEVFGRPADEVGIRSFTGSAGRIAPGDEVTLSWEVEDVQRLELYPGIGSVGAQTGPDGTGQITLKPAASTEFILVATSSAGKFTRAVSVQVGDAAPAVRIEEVVAANRYSVEDGFGDAPDWIELHNPGSEPVDLAGWRLTDDANRPARWTFPATVIEPHASLIVFASGRDEAADPAGHPHAGFRLDNRGGELWLSAPDGAVVDRVSYPELDTDLAYGRDLAGAWTFLEPTPGAFNVAQTWEGWLKAPDWSHARGFHETPFELTLVNRSPGSTLLYSRDGGPPSQPYAGPLPVNQTTVIRAQPVRPGWKSPPVATKTFIFLDDVIASRVMRTSITHNSAYAPRLRPGLLALPTIALSLPGQPEYEEQEGSCEIIWPDGRNPIQFNCGLSRFGNAWTKFEKRSFRIKCRARYGLAKVKVPLFDGFDRGVQVARSFDKLDLRSGSQDMSQRGFYMAGRFVEDSMLDMGSLNPHGRFVHVYLNGVYWGQYDCRELLEEHFLADYLGGSDTDYVRVRGNDNVGSSFVIGAPDPPHLEPWEHARAVRNSYRQLRDYVDIPHLIDFMLLWSYGNCETEYRACGPIEPGGSGFKFWIADADGFLRTRALGKNTVTKNGPGDFWSGLRSEGDPDFKMLVADHIYRHFFNGGALTTEACDARLADRMEEIQDSLILECARWGIRTPSNWQAAAAEIRSQLFPARPAQLLGYLRNAGLWPSVEPPVFNQYGGLVTPGFVPVLTASGGAILYTLDGSDPRLPGGAVSPSAQTWTPGGLVVTNDLTLNVRVRNAAGQWSALAQPSFYVAPRRAPAPGDLLITEIQYNPAGSDDFEFVELWNASDNVLDLSGVTLDDAVRFLFPADFTVAPGGFVVVAEDAAAFAARYQAPGSTWFHPDIRLAGQWTGALGDGGETLRLLGADGAELLAVSYRATGDWPSAPDGRGSSLELRDPASIAQAADPAAALADGRNWRASSRFHGSPGRFDDFTSPVRINEVLSHSDTGDDWIELLNTSDHEAALSECTLTDDLDRPARYAFPAHTILPPGGFLRVDAAELGFAFSELGSEAALVQMNGADPVRIWDRVKLPAAAPDEPLGRFVRSDGGDEFTELRAATPLAANALPRVGPVVISEILFAPRAGRTEFVELANLTGDPVALFDPLRPTNRWRLAGVGPFEFPAGVTLAPGGVAIVCSTDPAAFRAQYGVPETVPVFGPWSGALDDDGETLKLLRPGTPEPDGTVPWYRVDWVAWRAVPPWPEVEPGGSLVRLPLEAYGNDPVNWRAAPPDGTPGQLPANRPPVVSVTGDTVATLGGGFDLTLEVADPDAPWQTLTVTPEELPPGSEFDPLDWHLTWTPLPGQAAGDYVARFTVSDGSPRGDSQTELLVTLHVNGALWLAAQRDGDQLRLSFPVQAGETYRLEAAADLAAPDWQTLQELTATETGTAEILDPGPSTLPARFYRLVWLDGE